MELKNVIKINVNKINVIKINLIKGLSRVKETAQSICNYARRPKRGTIILPPQSLHSYQALVQAKQFHFFQCSTKVPV